MRIFSRSLMPSDFLRAFSIRNCKYPNGRGLFVGNAYTGLGLKDVGWSVACVDIVTNFCICRVN